MHYENQANIVFYILAAISSIVLLAGILGMVQVWRLGKPPTLNTDIKVSKWLRSILKASFLETQILEYGFFAWVAHLMIFGGFVSLLSKMILIKQCAKDKWEQFWKEKLGIKGYFNIRIQTIEINLCPNF